MSEHPASKELCINPECDFCAWSEVMTITQQEWQRRYAARLMDRASWNESAAIDWANDAYHSMLKDFPELAANPEGAADEEISTWEHDGNE